MSSIDTESSSELGTGGVIFVLFVFLTLLCTGGWYVWVGTLFGLPRRPNEAMIAVFLALGWILMFAGAGDPLGDDPQ